MDSWERFIQVSDSLWFTTNLLKRPSSYSSSSSAKDHLNVSIPLELPQACSVPVIQQMGCLVETQKAVLVEGVKEEKSRAMERREIKGCLDLGFALEEIGLAERLVAIIQDLQKGKVGGMEERSRCSSQLRCEMPPLSNGMAMKEHLKSWAFAVACTVG